MITKFRVWHTEWKEFVTDYPICMNVLTGKIVKFSYGEYSSEENIEDTKYTLLRYTGLKDKNDVEMFEGDIVDCYKEGLSTVKFEQGCFGLLCNGYFESFENVLGKLEIIGNKFEHPHLLEG